MDRRQRQLVSTVTLAVASVLVVVAAVWGWGALFPSADEQAEAPAAAPQEPCDPGEPVRVQAEDVTVSVFNAGDRAGQAGAALSAFEARGFRAGAIGNAAPDEPVRRALVIGNPEDLRVQLVARQLGRRTQVAPGEQLGPGVTVFVGNRWDGLSRAPRQVVVQPEDC